LASTAAAFHNDSFRAGQALPSKKAVQAICDEWDSVTQVVDVLRGGHMVFLAAEGIRGKPVDERLKVLLTVMGVVFLLGLIVVLSIQDVGTLLQLFG